VLKPAGCVAVFSKLDSDQEFKNHVESAHPLQLAVHAMRVEDHGRAEYFVQAFYKTFLAEWSGYHRLATTARLHQIEGLQVAVEIEEMMRTYS
jgi:hypothetical protein